MLRWSTNFGKWALAIKSGRYERRQLFLDEVLHLGRLEYPDERPEPRIVLFLRLCRKTHDQLVINGAIDDQGRLRITARADQIGNVDKSKRHIIERTIGLRGVKLDDVEVFRLSTMSNLLTEKPFPGVSLINPARSRRINPRAPLSGSLGIATLSPDLTSSRLLILWENSPTGAITPTLSTWTSLSPRCLFWSAR